MQVQLNGRKVTLKQADIIGIGGEATVFRHQNQAVKIYLQPDANREQKLRAIFPKMRGLPRQVIAPHDLVFDKKGGDVIGFTMRLLPSDYTEIRQLSSKKYRKTAGLSSRDIATMFLEMHRSLNRIHKAQFVVGDLNDLNLMFKAHETLFIDVDSFQFGNYPCVVGTEAFIDPMLYGCDLSQQAFFMPEHDWYSYAVLLFKALLLTHPYGGVHPTLQLLTQRAQQKIAVFDSAVTYPRVAYPLDTLSDDLLQVFDSWFTNGQRGIFPDHLLVDYRSQLVDCPSCGVAYPQNRSHCPACATVVPVTSIPLTSLETLIRANGAIVAWGLDEASIRAIAYENGKAVYYNYNPKSPLKQVELFKSLPTARYQFLKDMLVISPQPDSKDLMLVDVSDDTPEPVLKTTTGLFGGREAMFGTSRESLYRLAGGYLMRGQRRYGQWVEDAVMSIAENQTWFQVDDRRERVFGYFRTYDRLNYWLLDGDSRVDVSLPELDADEFLVDMTVKFAKNSLLVMRRTQQQGAEQLRVDEVNLRGGVLQSLITPDVEAYETVTYAPNMILRASEKGIVQERIDSRFTKTFTQTESAVRQGQAIEAYQQGLAVLLDRRVIYLRV